MKTVKQVSKTLVIANWKMNPSTLTEATDLFLDVKNIAGKLANVQTVICPPDIYLDELSRLFRGTRLALGAQDVFWEKKGSYTGEVAAGMLTSVGATYVIIGHSERRALGESNEDVNKKTHSAIKAGLIPIFCVGESDRDSHGEYLSFIKEELTIGLRDVKRSELKDMIIAYEPIWAIGKEGVDAMTPRDLHETTLLIRKIIAELYDKKTALDLPIVYGGSVEPSNVEGLMKEGMVGGFLVGHASLKVSDFSSILKVLNTLE